MKKRSISITAFLFLCVVVTTTKVAAQIKADSVNLPIELIGGKEGLSQGFVPSMLQDRDGFMWFATKDGLNKYDGYHMKVFRNHLNTSHEKYQLADNDIAFIAEDTFSFIWVSTVSKGLFVMDKRTDKFYPVHMESKEEYALAYIQCVGNYLFANTTDDWFVYNLSSIREQINQSYDSLHLTLITSYRHHQIAQKLPLKQGWFALTMMPDYSIWMTRKDTFLVFNHDGKTQWKPSFLSAKEFGMQGESIFHFFSMQEGNALAFISPSKLSIYDRRTRQLGYQLDFKEDAITKEIFYYNFPAKIGQDQLLFSGRHAWYLFNITSKHILSLKAKAGDFSGISRWLSKDGMLWVGSAGRGIYKYNLNAAKFHTDYPDGNGFETNALDEVFVKFRDGTKRYDYVTKKRYSPIPPEIYSQEVKQAWLWHSDPQGNLWYGALSKSKRYKGTKDTLVLLIQYNPRSKRCIRFDSLFRRDIYFSPNGYPAFFIDSKNRCWQRTHTTDGRILFYVTSLTETSKTTCYEFPKKYIQHNGVYRFGRHLEDRNGNIWFATNAGLYCFHMQQKVWTVLLHSDQNHHSLSANQITCLIEDKKKTGILWVGTAGNGFNKLDLQTLTCERYSDRNGLANNVVNDMQQDNSGRVWISTNQGISCFYYPTKEIINYSQEDGLAGNEFNIGQSAQLKNGQLFFGGVDGITFFNPSEFSIQTKNESKVVFTKLVLLNETVDCIRNPDVLKQAIGLAQEIVVPYDKNILRFEFSLLQFAPTEKKKYRYFLEGYTKTWIDNGSNNSIAFTNLNPGTYHLRVQGCSSNGIWSTQEAMLKIRILTPWYKSWWFYTLIILSIAALLYLWYRYRLKQSLKMVMMRNVIASDLHDEIGSTISSISLYSDIIEHKIEENNVKEIAQRIGVSSREILLAMSDIVWSINPKNDRFDNVVLRMKSFANDVLEVQNKLVQFDIDPSLMQVNLPMDQRKNFYLIFKEAIHNAVKYAQAHEVKITLKAVQRELVMRIEDDGVGFNTADISEGNGLHNMQYRANELQGKLQIVSQVGEGTCIELRFPFK